MHRIDRSSAPLLTRALLVVALLAACQRGTSNESGDAFGRSSQAVWVNGDFESDAIGASPPTGWSVTTYSNGGVTGSSAAPPLTESALNLGGSSTVETFIVGGTAGSQTDPDLGTGQSFRFPRFGVRASRVNYLDATNYGQNKNNNALRQTMTVGTGDIDPVDGQLHVRFAVAPVLENPSHSYTQQPYYFVSLKNLTKGTQLYADFNTAGQPGVPWKTTTSVATGNPTLWTDWQLVDVPGDAGITIGDQVQLTVIGSGCSLGGHFGRVYVDGLGSTVPGLYTWASGPASAASGSAITYTLNYRNGGAGAAFGAELNFTTPPNTTFVSTTGANCTTPAAGSAGTMTCPLGTLQPGATGSFSVTVGIAAAATGTLIMGNYAIDAANASPLLGAKVVTQLTSSSTQFADISVTNSDGVAQANWGGSLTYTVVVKNNGAVNATGVDVSDTLPPELTNVTWTCSRSSGSARCTASGSGNIADTVVLPAGASVTYTVNATVAAGSGSGSISHKVTAGSATGTVDPLPSNNSALDYDQIGTPRTLTVTKTGGAASGAILVAPATSAGCDTGCTSASGVYADGSQVVLSVAPATGYTFSGWGGACASAGSATNCTVTMSGNQAVSATFTAIPLPGAAAAIYLYGGDGQYAQTSHAFLNPLKAYVSDSYGNPVANATVSFSVPASGASAVLGTPTKTDAWGVASVTATANATTGSYQVTASVSGVAQTVKFNLTNTGVPKKLVYVMGGDNGTPQNAAVGTAYASPLVGTVTDQNNRPVPGVTVTLAPPATGASVTLSTTTPVTDGSGQFSVTATANLVAGGVNVGATASGTNGITFVLNNQAVTPAHVAIVSGSPQSTTATTAFGAPLVVSVTDANGNPVANQTVTFTPPASGASASLSSLTASTNSSGTASITATANGTSGSYNVTATAAGVATGVSFALTNTPLPPATIQVASGTPQSTRTGSAFASPLVVALTTSLGAPASGVTVTFSAPASGASATLSATTAVTDASGQATISATANGTAGSYSVSASAPGFTGSASFALTNVTWNLSVVSGSPQSATVASGFGAPLVVKVLDSNSQPVNGVSVSFSAPASGATASLSAASATTDGSGQASVTATAGTVAGTFAVTASASGVTGTGSFSLTNTAGAAASIAAVSGTPQSTTVGSAFAAPLVAKVTDAYGNAVAGVSVIFGSPSSGASASLATSPATTNASGLASVSASANPISGSYAISATTSGAGSASFSLTNKPGPAAIISVVSGTPQGTKVATAFTAPLVAKVTDAFGNAVPGATVSFGVPASGAGATLSASTSSTDASGSASVTATANTVAGSYSVSASSAGVASSVGFSLTNTAGNAAAIAAFSGSPQSATVGSAFASPLVARVTDQYGNAVPGVSVTFSGPASGAGASLATSPATTDAAGKAAVSATANSTSGSYSVSATAAGVATGTSFSLTNNPGAAAAVAVFSGSPQSTIVGSAFGAPLVARVTDSFGNPVPNAVVTFSSSASGAGATFGANPVTTDASGKASVNATANTTAGSHTASASVSGVTTTASFALTNNPGPASAIAAFSGTPQSATVGSAFASPLVARVTDAYGNAVPGVSVTFSGPASGAGASVASSPATTDASGKAAVSATANSTAGSYAISASAAGTGRPASFSLTNNPGAASAISAFSGTPQSAIVGTAFAAPLVARVTDAFGNGVPGVSVTFAAPASGASASLATSPATTDASGRATVSATAGSTSGSYTVTATASVGSASFQLTNNPGAAAAVAVFSGSPQSTIVGIAFPAPLVAKVTDAFGNAVPGASVTFSGPASGAGASVASSPATTDSAGKASVSATASTTAGSYAINASVSGVGSPASFSLTNNPGAAAAIAAFSGTPQSATVGTSFGSLLVAKVSDAYGNPVPGVSVAFSAPATGASAGIASSPAATDSAGKATVSVTANTVSGSYSVSASATGTGTPASFSLSNNPGAPSAIAVVSGSPQSTIVGTSFAAPLVAKVSDGYGNPVPGVSVTFSAPASGASASIATGPATTDANGRASVGATANGTSGSYSIAANASGVGSGASFSLTNAAGAPAAISVFSGSPQSTTVGTAFGSALVAKVVDGQGNPVPGATVTFAAPGSGASATLSATSATTDAAGKASVSATAKTTSGAYLVNASVSGVSSTAGFSLTNTPGAASAIAALSGTPQTATVSSAFGASLVAKVTDSFGNPVPGVSVIFGSPSSGASATLSAASATTDASGRATVGATAGTVSGTYAITAGASGISTPATFDLTNAPGAAAALATFSGTPQSATVASPFAAPLVARVTDAYGNGVPGVSVSFGAPASGASASLTGSPATTDASGKASVSATANVTSGSYDVTASASGLSSVAFTLTNTAGTGAAIAVVSGSPQSTIVGTSFSAPLVVKVTDTQGNAVSGVTVTFGAPASGASATFSSSSAITDGAGRATVTATANGTKGSYGVSAVINGVVTPATFSLTNTPDAAAQIAVASGTPQSATVGATFAAALVAQVTDSFGNPVPGVSVAFAAPASGAAASLSPSSAVTDATGRVSVSAAAGTKSGSYAITATAAGVATPASFALTNVAGAASAIAAISGTPQSTTVGSAFGSPLVAQVSDAYGNPVPGVVVNYGSPSSGASATLSGATATTDATGKASLGATANTTSGSYSVSATASGITTPATFSLTNTAGIAASFVVVTGSSPQSTTVGSAFGAPLAVKVLDAYGNAVSGASVTFTSPSSGATATLASGAATSDASGRAAVIATAGTISGTYDISVSVAGVSGTGKITLTNLPGAAATIAVVSGSPQITTVGSAFAGALVAQVTDVHGNAVPGATVSFSAPASGASATIGSGSVTTDAAGKATVAASANTVAGSYSVSASTAGVSTSASFSLTNSAGAAASLVALSGTPQTATVGTAFGAPLVVKVADAYGNPVLGATVNYGSPSSGASATLSAASATTDANGRASITATAGTTSGSYTISANTAGIGASAGFSLTNAPGAAAGISALSGTPQSATVASAFAAPLVALVTDSFGNPVPGAVVNYGSPSSGASAVLSAPSATTDANGRASVGATANTKSGGYSASATVAGLSTAASFSLANQPGAATTVSLVSGSPQSTIVGSAFAAPLVVKVVDAYGNPVPGASVSFAVPASGASAAISGSPATTDANGEAAVAATAGTVAGSYSVKASVSGVPTPLSIGLSNTAGAAASVVALSGTPQSATVGSAFSAPLVAFVSDSYGNPVAGAKVAFGVPASGAGATVAGSPATTDANGRASVTASAGTTAGSYAVTATVSGVASGADFALTNTAGAAASIATVSGTPQSAAVAGAFAAPLVAKVSDAFGNPVAGVSVAFAAPAAGAAASLSAASASTDAAGRVSVTATAGTTSGAYDVTANAAGVSAPATFSLANLPGAPAAIALDSGSPQSATVGTDFAAALVAKVTDTYGNPVPGASVSFSGPASGATATLATSPAITDAGGRATVNAKAGTVSGTYDVTASVTGVSSPALFHLTNKPGTATLVATVSGTPQTAKVGTAFAAELVAKVTDAYGNAVPGVSLTFGAPGSGATATVATASATTDAGGLAKTAVTAGTTAGAYEVSASVTGVTQSARFSLTNAAGAAAAISAVSGTPQATTVGTAFPSPLVVLVTDAYGNAVSGADVQFDVPASGATAALSSAIATTDAAGHATIDAEAGTHAGAFQVSASVTGVAQSAFFDLVNAPGAAAAIVASSGTPQETTVGTAFPAPLVAKVTDAFDNAVPGVTVIYGSPGSGATAVLAGSPATTNASGEVSIDARAGTVSGTYDVTASAFGVASPALFSLTNDPGAPAAIVVESGTPQHATVKDAFAAQLVARVTDKFGNAVPNVAVAFAGPASGAGATLAKSSVATDAQGRASTGATANATAGTYAVSASVTTLSLVASFALTNDPGAPASLVALSGTPQDATVATAFGATLVAKVTDAFGNTVPGVDVSFAAPGAGASATLSAASATTDANGTARVQATADTRAGSYSVKATLAGLGEAAFALTNKAGTAAAIAATTGSPQQATVNSSFGDALVATVTDSYGNPVPGAKVTLSAPASGPTARLAATTATTDANGRISVTALAGAVAGDYVVTVTVPGAPDAASFQLTNVPGTPKQLILVSGDNQTATVATDYAQPLKVRLLDGDGNPVPLVTVVYSVPGSGATATLSPATVVTDAAGEASVTAHAGETAGSFGVDATTASGLPVTFHLQNQAGAAVSLRITPTSDHQAATVEEPFAAPLEVTAVDAYGNPVGGAQITFTLPSEGAGATAAETTLTTGDDGTAQLPVTANGTSGTYEVTATLAGGADVLATFTLTNLAGPAVAVTVDSGSPAGTTVHTPFDDALVVVVRDAHGNPVAGAQVTFTAPASGASASLDSPVATTDADGRARVAATAGDVAGTYLVTATVDGAARPVSFELTNIPGAPASLRVEASGTPQSAKAGTGFSAPLAVTVLDGYGNAVPGATVDFTSPADGTTAQLAASQATTDAGGRASTTAVAGSLVGGYVVRATVEGTELAGTFDLTNLPGDPAQIAISGGNSQATRVHSSFAEALAVVVTDAFGNAVPDAVVAFAGPSSGARALFDATATTDHQGAAAVQATAGDVAGSYEVTATVAGGSAPAVFALTNLPGAPAKLQALPGGTPQTARVRQPFAHALEVFVTDAWENAVPQAEVSYEAPETGPTATISARARAAVVTTSTDEKGIASASAVAGSAVGQYTVVARVAGVSDPLEFHLANTGGAPATVALVSGGGQTTEALSAFAEPLVVRVRDADGNAAEGIALAFDAGTTGLRTTGSLVTDANGEASLTVTAGAKVGATPVSVGAEGVAAPVVVPFTVTAIPTTTTLEVPPELVSVSAPLHLVSTTTAHAGTPQGTVHFFADGREIGHVATGADGKATVDLPAPSPGTRTIIAKFAGSEPYADSASAGSTVEIEDNVLKGGGGCASAGGAGGLGALLGAMVLLLGARRRVRA